MHSQGMALSRPLSICNICSRSLLGAGPRMEISFMEKERMGWMFFHLTSPLRLHTTQNISSLPLLHRAHFRRHVVKCREREVSEVGSVALFFWRLVVRKRLNHCCRTVGVISSQRIELALILTRLSFSHKTLTQWTLFSPAHPGHEFPSSPTVP